MTEIFLTICIIVSVVFGYVMASGTWKVKHQQEQIHNETLRILLDEATNKEFELKTTIDILRAEIHFLRDEIDDLKKSIR